MLNAERGDCGSVAAIIEQAGGRGRVQGDRWEHQRGTCSLMIPTLVPVPSFDLNCTDPLGRTALSIAIINENPELMEILLEAGIQVLVLGTIMILCTFLDKNEPFQAILEDTIHRGLPNPGGHAACHCFSRN